MRINGKLIGKLYAHTSENSALIDRILEIYETKNKMKFYLFNSSIKGWHNEHQIINKVIIDKYTINKVLIPTCICEIMKKFNLDFSGNFTNEDEDYVFTNGMQIHSETIGYWSKDKFGKITYQGDFSDNGFHYKNLKAWELCNGVIYIGEYQLQDVQDGTESIENLWTRDSWIQWVKDTIKEKYSNEKDINEIIKSDDFIEKLAYDCLINADWQDLSTLFDDYDNNDDWVLSTWEEYKNNIL